MKMITPYVANENRDMKVKERKGENSGPRQSTLEWIRPFARVYAHEPPLGTDSLGSFVMN